MGPKRRVWRKGTAAGAAVALLLATAAGAPTAFESARTKVDSIQKGRVTAGQRVSFSDAELTAYARHEGKELVPAAREVTVASLGGNRASGRALVDFLKLRPPGSPDPPWLIRRLLEGERPVEVEGRVDSGNGQAAFYPESVTVSGIPLSGSALDWVIRNYVVPNYPEVRVGKPIPIGYGVDRLEGTPGRVDVVMSRTIPKRLAGR